MTKQVAAVFILFGPAALGQTVPTLPKVNGPLSVTQAVQNGLRYSPGIRAAQADVKAAQADTNAAKSMTLPQISANTFLTTGSMGSMMTSSPGVTPPMSIDLPSKPYADQNLTLMVPLYTGGRLSSVVRAGSHRERAAAAGVSGTQADVAIRIKDAYYRTLLAGEIGKVAQARAAADQTAADNAQALFEAGKGIEASVSRAQADLADAQRMLTSAQNDEAKMLLDLKAAMGVSADSDVSLSDSLSYAPLTGTVDGSVAEALKNRPEVLAARARVAAAQADVGAARGSQRPQVYGAVMADAFSPQQNMGAGAGYTAGITISFPLLDSGQRRSEVARAEAGVARAQAEEAAAELAAGTEVRQAWLDVQTADQNYRTGQAGVRAAQQAYDVTVLRVQNNKGILVEQLDALAALTQARSSLAQALYDHAIAVARLQRAVGRTE